MTRPRSAQERRRLRETLVREAVVASSARREGVNLVSLAMRLAKKHGLSVDTVKFVLSEAPELRMVDFMIVPRSQPVGNPGQGGTETRRSSSPEDGPFSDIRLHLSELDTDAVLVDARSRRDDPDLIRARFDFVQRPSHVQIWLALLITRPDQLAAITEPYADVLSDGMRLPLTPREKVSDVPTVLVWRMREPHVATARLQRILMDQLRLSGSHLTVTKEACSPGELEKRVNDARTVQRLRGRGSNRNFTQRSCDHCGQPLSDPTSVALGIGPECRRHYSKTVLSAARDRSGARTLRPGKPEAAWLVELAVQWRLSPNGG